MKNSIIFYQNLQVFIGFKKQFLVAINLLLALFLCSLTLFAQTNQLSTQNTIKSTLRGTISTENKPAEFVNVMLLGTNLGTNTDSLGKFSIRNVPVGNYQLQVSGIGYKTLKINVKVENIKTISLNLELQTDQNQLNEIVVTGTMKEVTLSESPVPVQSFTSMFFKKNPTPALFDALQNINGVRPQLNCSICNTGDIHINGMEGAYTMVMIDGMPIVSSLSTVYGLNGIPNSLIERVEIVKGAASTLYGSEAVAGLINVITKSPKRAAKFAFDVFASTDKEYNIDISSKKSFGKQQNITSLFAANYFHFDNIFDRNHDGFTDLTQQKRISLFNKWNFERKEKRQANIALRYLYEDRWGGQTNWQRKYRGGEEVYGESIFTSRWELIGNYQLPIKEKIQVNYSFTSHNQNSYYGSTPYMATQNIGFGQLTWDKKIGKKHDLLIGAAFRYTFYDDNTPATASADTLNPENQPNKIYLPAIFVQDELTLHKNHKLLLGLRYDNHSIHGNVFSPRFAYKWTWKSGDIWRFNVGNGFRVVNVFTEDHAALTGSRKVEITRALAPEQSWNFNLSWQKFYYHKIGTLGFEANVFYTYFSNKIVPDYLTDVNKIIYSNLQGYAVSRGFAANTDLTFNIPLKITAGFTFLDVFRVENGETQKQVQVSPFSGTFNVSYTFEKANISLDWTGNCYSPMPLPILTNDFRDSHSPWFSTQNIQVTKKFVGGFECYAGVKNLFNFVPQNPIMRPFDPFDKQIAVNNPNGYTFDATYNYASLQGIRGFAGLRWAIH
jgi:outer membrane receptor for ferrienterochelin and colicins